MRYTKACKVTVYKRGGGYSFEILYPVRDNGSRNLLGSYFTITSPSYVYRGVCNNNINTIKEGLKLREVKRKHIDVDKRVKG